MSPQIVHEPCPWALDVSCPCDLPEGVDPELIDRMTNVATSTLWRLSGWTYPACEVEARPCARRCLPELFDFARAPWVPWLIDGHITNVVTCPCPTRGCSCRQLDIVVLPGLWQTGQARKT